MLTSALKKLLALSLIVCLNIGSAWSQCESWAGNPNEEELTEFYVLVTDFIKAKDYDNAFEYWQKLYAECPAADGKRKGVFTSGRTIYLDKFTKETATNIIVCFHENLSQTRFSNGVILSIKLVKSVKSVAILYLEKESKLNLPGLISRDL